MLKFVFGCLLLVNIGLLGFQLGWLDALVRGGHEPQRLKSEINADKFRLLSPRPPAAQPAPAAVPPSTSAPVSSVAPAAAAPSPAASSGPAPVADATAVPGASAAQPAPAVSVVPVLAQAAVAQQSVACVEIGNLTLAEAKRFEARLATLTLAVQPVRREVREESSHMVWIPPLPTGKAGADRKSAELRSLGVRDFYVFQDDPVLRHGISLGVFTTEAAAQARLATLGQQGVRSARLVEYKMPLSRAAFQLSGVDDRARQALDRIRSDFPRHVEKPCTA